jgi:hypothetical protein
MSKPAYFSNFLSIRFGLALQGASAAALVNSMKAGAR